MKKFLFLVVVVSFILTTNVYASETKDEESVWFLAHVINGEAGADYCSDDLMKYVGSVVLNRVEDKDFPNTVEDVIFAEGQYECVTRGTFYLEPNERCWSIARYLVEHGSVLPTYVIWQAEFPQGQGWYCKEQNMYFCTKVGTN